MNYGRSCCPPPSRVRVSSCETEILLYEPSLARLAPKLADLLGGLVLSGRSVACPLSGGPLSAALRFPVPADDGHRETKTEAGLVRAADLIGQLADPFYPRKLNALFHELDEIGCARHFERRPRTRRAARPLERLVAENRLQDLPGIGTTIAEVMQELHREGHHPFLDELRKRCLRPYSKCSQFQGSDPKRS
jgi:hypothetical protein